MMGDDSKIEWTDATWNPVVGCRRVSEGCRNCYAETVAAGNVRRLRGVVEKTGSAKAASTLAAYEQAVRIDADGNPRPLWSGRAIERPDVLDQPLRWSKPRRIFVNSMSDLFHDDVSNEYIAAVWAVMMACPQHTFQVLTKRPARMREWFGWLQREPSLAVYDAFDVLTKAHPDGDHAAWCRRLGGAWIPAEHDEEERRYDPPSWDIPDLRASAPHVHIGVSVEDQQSADERIPLLLQCPAAVRWVSAEPLLGPVDFERVYAGRPGDDMGHLDVLEGRFIAATGYPETDAELSCDDGSACIDWIVVGGESGPGARPMHPEWVRDIRDQCQRADVPLFFKQWGEWAPRGGSVPMDGGATPGEMTRSTVIDSTDRSQIGTTRWRCHSEGVTESLARVGKKSAGRLIDGVEHNDGPRERDA